MIICPECAEKSVFGTFYLQSGGIRGIIKQINSGVIRCRIF